MPWHWLAGCCGSRNHSAASSQQTAPTSLPLTSPPPHAAPGHPGVAAPAQPLPKLMPTVFAATPKQKLTRAWADAMTPLAPPAPQGARSASKLATRAAVLAQLRAAQLQPPHRELTRVFDEGLLELKREGEWADPSGAPRPHAAPDAGVIAHKAQLLLDAFAHSTTSKRRVANTAVLAMLRVRDESLCHRGATEEVQAALERFVKSAGVIAKPLAFEVALASAPALADPLRAYLPAMPVRPVEVTAVKNRLLERIAYLDSAPAHREGAADVLFGGRLRLIEECDVLAGLCGIAPSAQSRQRLCRACLFELEFVVRSPWQQTEPSRSAWPAKEAAAAWLLHRARLFRLFAPELRWLREEMVRIEQKVSFFQSETMHLVAIRQRHPLMTADI